MRITPLLLTIGFLLTATAIDHVWAQTSDTSKQKEYIDETFHTFRTVSGHSVETMWKNYLMMTISHRFAGTVNSGVDELFGMDQGAYFRLGFAYGITDHLTVGLGRTTLDKMYDGYVKYRFIRQAQNGWPVTATLYAAIAINSDDFTSDQEDFLDFSHRVSYDVELLIARKFGRRLAIQLSPAMVHHNYTSFRNEENTTWALGTAVAFNFNDQLSLTAEWVPTFNQSEIEDGTRYDAFGLSFNIRSSKKHEYQIQFSNTSGLIGQQYIPHTRDDFFDNGIHFGFHMTRRFGV